MPQGEAQAVVAALLVLLLSALAALAQAPPAFPPLTGRVVDAANVLSPEAERAIEAKLKAHEDRSGRQVAVATVPSLGDLTVEDYANRLFRAWGLGDKTRNDGALLLVAPRERKVRIEVGYGLEGTLTDALTGVIVRTAMAPRFRDGDFAGGVSAGVDAVLSVLSGDAEEWRPRTKVRRDDAGSVDLFTILFVAVLLFIVVSALLRSGGGGGPGRPHRRRSGGWVVLPVPSGGGFSGGGWSGGGSFGGVGGFSGGGGSSGGGGASGSW